MIITHEILHIFDTKSGNATYSSKELDLSNEITINYIIKTTKSVLNNSNKRRGVFNPQSNFMNLLNKYKNKEIDFINLSNTISKDLYEILKQSDEGFQLDLMIGEFREESKTYLSIIFLKNKESITHKIIVDGSNISNAIVKNYQILPESGLNLQTFCYIDLDSYEVFSAEKTIKINGNSSYFLETYLNTTYQKSDNEQFKIIKNVCQKVCENYGINPAITIGKTKSYLASNPILNIKPEQISEVVFEKNEEAKKDFDVKMHSKGMASNITIDHSYALKKASNQKIKTDNGIEIVLPIEYLDDDKYIEFIEESDGTMSIRLKNIGKISNR